MKRFNIIRGTTAKKTVIVLIAFLVIYSILLSSVITKTYNLKEGDIAKSDIVATKDVLDTVSTAAKKKQAADNVGEQYDLNVSIEQNAESQINDDFTKINNIRASNAAENDKVSSIKNGLSYNYNFTDNDINNLLTMNKTVLDALQQFILKTIKSMYANNIREDVPDDLTKASAFVDTTFDNSKFSDDINKIGIVMTKSLIKPNLTVDMEKTNELKTEAVEKVTPVMIKKDQIVVSAGQPVTKAELQILNDLGLINNFNTVNWCIYFNLAILTLVILFLEVYYLFKKKKELYNDNSKLILIFLINVISLIFARSIGLISLYLIPFAYVPMLLTLLLDNEASFFISILNCVLLSCISDFNIQITLIAVMSAVLVSVLQKKMQMRNDLFSSAIYISVILSFATFSTGFLLSNNTIDILQNSGFVIIGIALASILTIGTLPFLESIFDIVTTVKLLELSNPNQPLLKRLLMEAPGTYHHSIFVANLAEVATEEIGGNPVLARVSAYYHDVGKIRRPYFFKENQIGIENPHDKVNGNLSSLIITSHVKDGLELAKEYKLPKIIQDIIVQHHGTTLVKYFYITMKNNSSNPEEIDEQNFRYDGPIPSTKESAVVMLSDSVEAAVRSITKPSKNKMEEVVNTIIKARLEEGQLDNCDLTLRDLDKIKKSFLKTLSGVYHERIEYPTEKIDK